MAMQQPTPIYRASDDPAAIDPGQRTPSDVANLLRRPFAPNVIKQRQIAGRNIAYVDIASVIDRLNRAAPVWSWSVTKIEIHTLPILRKGELVNTPVVHVTGCLSIPGLGSRESIGTAPAENNEDASKIAESDAIKRAATMFGVPAGR